MSFEFDCNIGLKIFQEILQILMNYHDIFSDSFAVKLKKTDYAENIIKEKLHWVLQE